MINLRFETALAAGAVTLFLLGASAAQAVEVLFDDLDPQLATGIRDLNVGGTLYDVDFKGPTEAVNIYGQTPALDFNDINSAAAAIDAANAELTAEGAFRVGPGAAAEGSLTYRVGYEVVGSGLTQTLKVVEAATEGADPWIRVPDPDIVLYNADSRMYADFTVVGGEPPPPSGVDLTGTVQDAGGTPLCALALASGQFMFTCDGSGSYSLLGLPTESDGSVKRQVYVDGFFPNVEPLPGSTDEIVVMTRASNCPDYNSFAEPGVFPDSAGKRINVSGTVLLQNTQTTVCAMALGNGQFGFTCDGTGTYSANIPLDNNGQYKLQVYADGFAPTIQLFDEFTPDVEVRLARAAECQ